ncbi:MULTISPECIES: glycerol-3-phosphate acyltransferase [unclassified Fredinandcohnia]|uniref:glycerol-3-phosphate acyltransferase n=1 Tax=unclassified Fredinandcohnia TaxID=2837514 RepID=UPI0030FDE1F7
MLGLVSIIIGYIFGCIHGSNIVGKLKKINIKESGVKNAGASNTTIVLGWKYGIIVALIDIGKGIVPVLIMRYWLSGYSLDERTFYILLFLNGAFVIIGHNFPVTMKFSGGKGTASMIGVAFAIDWKVGLIGFVLLILITLISDYLPIGVLVMYLSWVVLTYLFGYPLSAILITFALTLLCIYKHMENWKRIQNQTETRVSSMFKKK